MKLLILLTFGIFLNLPALADVSRNPFEISIAPDAIQEQHNRYYSYNFGTVRVNWSQYADFVLRNTGSSVLHIRGVYISGTSYWAWTNCPRYLRPGQRCLARVEFRPWSEGYYTGRLRFALSYGNIFVDLYGWGSRY